MQTIPEYYDAISTYHYDRDMGSLIWIRKSAYCVKLGSVAGHLHKPSGYIRVRFNGRSCAAHRIAWLIVYGRWPVCEIDHINGVRNDNRLVNLRETVRKEENNQNTCIYASNKTGFHGVGFHNASGKWRGRIQHKGKQYNLGLFDSPELANEACMKAKYRLHSFQPILREYL